MYSVGKMGHTRVNVLCGQNELWLLQQMVCVVPVEHQRVGWFLGWLVSCLVGWLLDRSVGWLVCWFGLSVCLFVGLSICLFVG